MERRSLASIQYPHTVTRNQNDHAIAWAKEPRQESERARICMPSLQAFKREAFQASLYEAQDILADVDRVDMLPMFPRRGFSSSAYWHRRLMWYDFTNKLKTTNPGLVSVELKQDYDLLIMFCQDWRDAFFVHAIEGWKDRCKTSLCYIDELWTGAVSLCEPVLDALSVFDHIVLGFHGSVDPLGKVLGRKCHHVPGAVDALRFSPYPEPPQRVVDFYSVGRRNPHIHQSLVDISAKQRRFYLHDTSVEEGVRMVKDHREHRNHFASIAKRSQFFMVAPAKMEMTDVTEGQLEVGFRYYEGAAAGAVLIGQAPDCPSYRDQFDWPNAVVELDVDGSDTAGVIGDLLGRPEAIEQISRRNAAEALRRHDWGHRWKDMLTIAGLQPSQGLLDREKWLQHLARIAESGDASAFSPRVPLAKM
jgi:hypothetical protein